MNKVRKMVLLSILISQALVLHVVERAIPVPVPVPGVKLGLANIISLITIILFGFKEAVLVVTLRTLLGSMFGGGLSSFLYSLAGGILSTTVMAYLYLRHKNIFSIPTISTVGAVFHNIGQIGVASLVISNIQLFYYLPVLLISGVITGILIGFTVQFTVEPVKKILRIGGA
ncbi:MAG: Gx transporter family protein [Lutispora sp.]|uniref:Gx transporter family protein n=1 Tax=Lutispora sp. TaxID=2828727 RepID=UPI00356A5EC1